MGTPEYLVRSEAFLYALEFRYSKEKRITDLNEMFTIQHLCAGGVDRQPTLGGLATIFHTFLRPPHPAPSTMFSSSTGELTRSLDALREQLRSLPKGHYHREAGLTLLGMRLAARFHLLGDEEDLSDAISAQREVLELRRVGDASYNVELVGVAAALSAFVEHADVMACLDESIDLYRQAIKNLPTSHFIITAAIGGLADVLVKRCRRTGSAADINEALQLHLRRVSLIPKQDPMHFDALARLSVCYGFHGEIVGCIPGSAEATAIRRILGLAPPTVEKDGRISSLGQRAPGNAIKALRAWVRDGELLPAGIFKGLESIPDLEEGVSFLKETLKQFPKGHPLHEPTLAYLRDVLSRLQEARGDDVTDLNEWTNLARTALMDPEQHYKRSTNLQGLSRSLLARADHTGEVTDITESIRLLDESAQLYPKGHPIRIEGLQILAKAHIQRWNQSHKVEDLTPAVDLYRECLTILPEKGPLRAEALTLLGNTLLLRFNHGHNLRDLNEASSAWDEARSLYKEAGAISSGFCQIMSFMAENMCVALLDAFNQTNAVGFLRDFIRTSLSITNNRPTRCGDLCNFAGRLQRIEQGVLILLTDGDHQEEAQQFANELHGITKSLHPNPQTEGNLTPAWGPPGLKTSRDFAKMTPVRLAWDPK